MSLDLIAVILFLVTIVERLFELVVSKRNAQWSLSRGGVEYGADHYRWMVVMHSAFLVVMILEFLIFNPDVSHGVRFAAIVVAMLCQITRWWIIHTLGHQWNTRVIVIAGMERIRRGPYRFLNHPNYVVVALETVALPMIFGAWRTALVFSFLNAWMMLVRIGVENQALKDLR
jgi:methyltransferase